MFLHRPNMRKVSAAVFMFFKRCWSVKHEVRAGVFHLHSFLNQLLTSVSFSLSVSQDWSRIFCRRCSFRFHFRLNKCTGKKKFSLCISNNSRGICRGVQWDLEKLFFWSSYELMTPKLSRIFCRGGEILVSSCVPWGDIQQFPASLTGLPRPLYYLSYRDSRWQGLTQGSNWNGESV